ncbi:MAG: hypothetical protein M1326_02405 [Cyanobacteria bacterium]|nr:hypothetical protein [Cyanobacteriota bacterium]
MPRICHGDVKSDIIFYLISSYCNENSLYLLHNDKDFEMMSQVESGFIRVKKVGKLIKTTLELELGELSTLLLTKELKIDEALID